MSIRSWILCSLATNSAAGPATATSNSRESCATSVARMTILELSTRVASMPRDLRIAFESCGGSRTPRRPAPATASGTIRSTETPSVEIHDPMALLRRSGVNPAERIASSISGSELSKSGSIATSPSVVNSASAISVAPVWR